MESIFLKGNSLYTEVNGATWEEAEANANKLGGHLVTINDAEEDKFLTDTFGLGHFFGLTDKEEEGNFKWVSGETLEYTNWEPYQPTDSGLQDYGAYHPLMGGYWDDVHNGHAGISGGISEIPFIQHGDSAYVIVEGPSWEEAEANANKLGGHLLTINSKDEYDFILSTYQNYYYGNATNEDGKYTVYLGLNDSDSEGYWEWISGEQSDWDIVWGAKDQINNLQPDNNAGKEHYGELYLAETEYFLRGQLNDVENNTEFIQGIAEIKLSSLNDGLLNLDYSNSSLSYKYEIYNADDPTEKISGLLGYDFNDTDESEIVFESDSSSGGAAEYNIKFYVKVEDSNAGSDATINLETLDVNFDLADGAGSTFFNDFSGATVDTSSTVFNTAITSSIDASGSGVRFTGAVSDKLKDASGVTNDGNYHNLFELKGVSINESVGEFLDKITFTDTTNIYDTVLSRRGGPHTATIKSISELTGASATQGFDVIDKYNDVSVHQAQSNLTNLGTNIYTQRYIGSNEKTNLIRANNVVSTHANVGLISESFWVNTGTYSEDLADITISDASGSAFSVLDKTLDISGGETSVDGWDLSLSKNGSIITNLEGLDVSQSDLSGSSLDASTIESAKLWTKLSFNDSEVEAGTNYSASSQAFQLKGQQSSSTSGFANKLSTNLITFQGDINYDGRVSLNDLAFLNAGKIAENAGGKFTDVDADFDGNLDVDDLAVLSADWGEKLNYSDTSNADFSGTNWTTIDTTLLTTAINTLEDLSGVTISEASGETLSDANIFSDDNLRLSYENSSYTHAQSVNDSFDSIGTGLTTTNSPYDTLIL